jgi:hypothetical protein
LSLRRGAVDIAFASGSEGPVSNPAKGLMIVGRQTLLLCQLNIMYYLCVQKEK